MWFLDMAEVGSHFPSSWRWWMMPILFCLFFLFFCVARSSGISQENLHILMAYKIQIHQNKRVCSISNRNTLGSQSQWFWWCLSLTKHVRIMWKLVELRHLINVKTSALEIVQRSFLKLDYRSCVYFYLMVKVILL